MPNEPVGQGLAPAACSDMIPGRRMAPTNLGNVCVLGLGVSGLAVANYLLSQPKGRVESLTVFAGQADESDSSAQALKERGAQVVFADHVDGTFDLCIASPGIPEPSDFYQSGKASSGELLSEVELAWRESPSDSLWVGITGTNGKTTTTALLEHLLNACGFAAKACGNIGDACIDVVATDVLEGALGTGLNARSAVSGAEDDEGALGTGLNARSAEASSSSASLTAERAFNPVPNAPSLRTPNPDAANDLRGCANVSLRTPNPDNVTPQRVYVAEVSSYQLASIQNFTPNAAIFLGITPDHLTWHGSMDAYADAKWKMLANMEASGGTAVIDAVNDISRGQVRRLRKAQPKDGFAYIPIGAKAGITTDMRDACGAENAAFLDEAEHLHVAYLEGEYILAPAEALKIKGEHNVVNALAASGAAIALGADGVDITNALPGFSPLEHRIEPAGTVDGVEFYNDSKATNVDATLVALSSFPGHPLYVMLGGRDKMGPLDELVAACQAHATAVIVFGEAAERFEAAFKAEADGKLPVVCVATFDEAFDAAAAMAKPGSVVLLSPACASFDEFSCFEERGQHFKDLVAARAARQA